MARTSKNALTIDDLLQESNYLSTIAPYQIPQNWCWTSLGKVCELGKGTSINHKSLPYWDAKSLRGMKEPDIIDSGIVVNAGEKVILVDGENSGEVFSIFEQGYMGSTFRTLHFSKVANEKYATFFIDFHHDQLRKSKIGSAIPHLNKELFFELPFPFPPFAEQQRIVDRIESLFAKLDEAKEKAQAVIDGYEDRKAAILHKAFTGELTRLWASQHGISVDAWKMKYFDDVAEVKSNLVDPAEYPDYPHIAPDNIEKKTGKLLDYNTVAEDAVKSGKHRFYAGQILYSKIRPNLSKVVVINFDGLCSADMYPIEPKDGVNTKFLWYYMLSDDFVLQASTAGSRSVLPKINQKELASLKIRITDFKEQEIIVAVLDKLFEKEQQAKEAAEQVIDQIDSMKKSILARAFRGELGTNDPNDESAVELLKRVLVEEQSDDTISKPAIKRTTIPKEMDTQLSTGMERDIIKLFIKADKDIVSMDAIMSLSSKKFEILDTLRALEKRGIIQKNDAGDYSLIK